MKLRAAVVQWLVEIRRLSSNDSGLSSSLESPKVSDSLAHSKAMLFLMRFEGCEGYRGDRHVW